jgi:uncharacterized protein (TIGR00369 family)
MVWKARRWTSDRIAAVQKASHTSTGGTRLHLNEFSLAGAEKRRNVICRPRRRQARRDPISGCAARWRGGSMTEQEHFDKLQHSYQAARCNEYYSPTLTVSHGTTELTILVDPKFFHTGGAVHGSVYFKALDDAAFFAASSVVHDVAVVTVSFTVHFVRPVSEGRLQAIGRVVHVGDRLVFAESTLTDTEHHLLAIGVGTFARTKIALSAAIGYS